MYLFLDSILFHLSICLFCFIFPSVHFFTNTNCLDFCSFIVSIEITQGKSSNFAFFFLFLLNSFKCSRTYVLYKFYNQLGNFYKTTTNLVEIFIGIIWSVVHYKDFAILKMRLLILKYTISFHLFKSFFFNFLQQCFIVFSEDIWSPFVRYSLKYFMIFVIL